jgi:tight adherence protein C
VIPKTVDPSDLVPYLAFGCIVCGIWGVLSIISRRNALAHERLARLGRPLSEHDIDQTKTKPKTKSENLLAMFDGAQALAPPLIPKTELELSALKLALANAGFRNESAMRVYLGTRFAALIVSASLGVSLFVPKYGFAFAGLKWVVILSGIGFYVPQVILWWLKRRRRVAIFLSLPDALDLLVVCVESGLGLDAAMRKVCEEMEDHAAILIQADRFGSSIAQALRVQSDSMRVRRKQIAEEKAAKTAVQLIFPLVLFIFPGIFVVLVGPAAILIAQKMLHQ